MSDICRDPIGICCPQCGRDFGETDPQFVGYVLEGRDGDMEYLASRLAGALCFNCEFSNRGGFVFPEEEE